jgi:cell wall-associated NlpC family hydrolase
MYVYNQLGIDLTHYTGAQWYEGARVPPSELQPGDLVFFEPSPRGPQHEGIYIGDGQFIHAPHTGDVVKISSLDDPSYWFGYVGAVRPSAP